MKSNKAWAIRYSYKGKHVERIAYTKTKAMSIAGVQLRLGRKVQVVEILKNPYR